MSEVQEATSESSNQAANMSDKIDVLQPQGIQLQPMISPGNVKVHAPSELNNQGMG